MRIHPLSFLAVTAGLVPAGRSLAQAALPPAIVHVRVTDTTGAPLQGVVITILKARQQAAVVVATSDAVGRHTFSLTPDSVNFQLVVRKLGFVQTARLVPVKPGDTMSFDLRLAKLPPQLDTIRVTAPEDSKHRAQFIDADAIAHSPRPLLDAIDIIDKLRPAMVWGVRGPIEHCAPASNVWVNGTLIRLPPLDNALATRQRMARAAGAATPHIGQTSAIAAMPIAALSVLSTIKPEHIASMEYKDCGDMSLGLVNSNSALFIVLKPGVGYSDTRGSYVDSTIAPPQ